LNGFGGGGAGSRSRAAIGSSLADVWGKKMAASISKSAAQRAIAVYSLFILGISPVALDVAIITLYCILLSTKFTSAKVSFRRGPRRYPRLIPTERPSAPILRRCDANNYARTHQTG
jgi:hypothetical protein